MALKDVGYNGYILRILGEIENLRCINAKENKYRYKFKRDKLEAVLQHIQAVTAKSLKLLNRH